MKNIIECDLFSREYNIGDVVYLARKNGEPTCRAVTVKNDNDFWVFKPLSEQSEFFTSGGLITFAGQPYIFAKEVEVKEEQP